MLDLNRWLSLKKANSDNLRPDLELLVVELFYQLPYN